MNKFYNLNNISNKIKIINNIFLINQKMNKIVIKIMLVHHYKNNNLYNKRVLLKLKNLYNKINNLFLINQEINLLIKYILNHNIRQ